MKVLILANNDVGLYQFRKELVAELLRSHQVFISLPYGDLVESLKEMGCEFFDTPLDRRGMNLLKDSKLLLAYLKYIKQLKPDLVLTYTIKPNIYGGLAARLLKTPYAVNITGLGTAFQGNGMFRKLITFLYKISLKSAYVVLFENEENRQVFVNAGIIPENRTCLLMGAGVNLEHYQPTEYPGGNTTKFLFIGRIMKEKGVDELFEAMKRLVKDGIPAELDVLGGYEENYREIISQSEVEGWLHYHGYQKDVRPFIANCHCFVLPSWHEGMANTNLECAASGRPVITSNIHGCMEAVEDGVSGFLCEKKNSTSLYEQMKKFCLLSHEEQRAMGLAGRRRMEDMFDKEKVVAKTLIHLPLK